MKKIYKTAAAVLMAVGAAGGAQAALHTRAGGTMVYDDLFNITWLSDLNYAQTSAYDSDGKMTWSSAKTWADNLVFGGYSDWRLPTLNPSLSPGAFGLGELGHLFQTDLGLNAPSGFPPSTTPASLLQLSNRGLFTNLKTGSVLSPAAYWSATSTVVPLLGSQPWAFGTTTRLQGPWIATSSFYAVAVRNGDVPEPTPLMLAIMGIGAVWLARRRRRA